LKKYIVIFFLIPFLSGCWDQVELEEQAYIIAIGLDKSEEGKVKITFVNANPEVGTTQGGSVDEPPTEIVSFVANDFVSARDTANAIIAKQLTFHHAKVLVVSEELAKTDDFLKMVYATLRETQLRREMNILVSKEKASDFLRNNKPLMESRQHKYFQFMINRAVETGLSPHSDVHRFMQITEGDADLYLAMYVTAVQNEDDNKMANEDEYYAGQIEKEGGNPTEVIGAAVFKEGKMIGRLTGEETRMSLLFDKSSKVETMLATYPDPLHENSRITARVIKKADTEIEMETNKPRPTIKVTVPISLELLAIPSLEEYIMDKDKQLLLEKSIERGLEKKARELVKKTQEEFKRQPFYWSLSVRSAFLTNKDYKKFDFAKKYPDMDIDINFHVDITEFGQQIRTPELPEVRE
jgi:spore germination protein KC